MCIKLLFNSNNKNEWNEIESSISLPSASKCGILRKPQLFSDQQSLYTTFRIRLLKKKKDPMRHNDVLRYCCLSPTGSPKKEDNARHVMSSFTVEGDMFLEEKVSDGMVYRTYEWILQCNIVDASPICLRVSLMILTKSMLSPIIQRKFLHKHYRHTLVCFLLLLRLPANLSHDYNHGAVAGRSYNINNAKLHQRWRFFPNHHHNPVWKLLVRLVMRINVVLHESIKCIKWLGKRTDHQSGWKIWALPPSQQHRNPSLNGFIWLWWWR